MYIYREPELDIAARIGITKEAYKLLRSAKKKEKQSMVKLVSDLIIEKYKSIKQGNDQR